MFTLNVMIEWRDYPTFGSKHLFYGVRSVEVLFTQRQGFLHFI